MQNCINSLVGQIGRKLKAEGAAGDRSTAPCYSSPLSGTERGAGGEAITPPSASHYRPPQTAARSWSGTTQPHCGHFPTLPSARHYPRTDSGPLCPAGGPHPLTPSPFRRGGTKGEFLSVRSAGLWLRRSF